MPGSRTVPIVNMSDRFEITIVYDSEGLEGYSTGWGFSALVRSQGGTTLFDCGWDGHMLRRNLGRLGVQFEDVDSVVLSHQHWDHISGLTEVLSGPPRAEPVEVFVPSSFSENLRREIARKANLHVVDGPSEVAPSVVTTGPLGREFKEQSLVLVLGDRCAVLTGCAHPGLGGILRSAGRFGRPSWLVGGLHGAAPSELPQDLEKAVLCHCTREKARMMTLFPRVACAGRVGETYTFERQ